MAKPIRRILVPVDFSPCSRSALEYAAMLATRFGASIDVLHVWEPPAYVPIDTALATIGTGPPQTLVQIAHAEATEDLQALISRLGKPEGGEVGGRIASGDPVDVIVKTASSVPYDLIVMGTHGRSGVRHLLMGSVAERVLRRAPCPVLTFRDPRPEPV